MSNLQRSFVTAKLAELPPFSPDSYDEQEEDELDTFTELPGDHPDDDSSSASSASSASSSGTIMPALSKNLFARPVRSSNKRSIDPIPWTQFFERELYLEHVTDAQRIILHAYLTSPTGSAPLFVTHHGAGSSGLSFAALTAEIRKLLPSAGILSLDARGHGSTAITPTDNSTSASKELDLSLPTLTNDLLQVLQLTQSCMSWPQLPPILLIGHSLGGAVVTTLASSHSDLLPSLLGYVVLDVVEGSAIDALTNMHTYLNTRPTGFTSIEQGIEWHIRSRTLRNAVSARCSVPALLRPIENKAENVPQEQEKETAGEAVSARGGKKWTWRTDLAATQPFWEGWFAGLSKKFLESKGGKLLLLAGTDRLDKELMIGQMQGKYALHVFPEAGHFIHEDLPEETARVIVDFYKRNDRRALVLPPKVSDLLKAGRQI